MTLAKMVAVAKADGAVGLAALLGVTYREGQDLLCLLYMLSLLDDRRGPARVALCEGRIAA